jgi:tRNA (guanine37-N1)-methyltransferase
MHFDIFTLFPGMFAGVFDDSILKRAQAAGIMSVALHNIRDYATGRHRVTDDTPYGGGGGMVMKPEPIFRAVETVLVHEPGWALPPGEDGAAAWAALGQGRDSGTADAGAAADTTATPPAAARAEPDRDLTPLLPDQPIILLTPQGRKFDQRVAQELADYRRVALVCGRYEGFDERIRAGLATDEISVGDFVLSGGELPAMIVVDAVTRLLPGALGYDMAPLEDSFATGLLEYPQYTKPPTFRGDDVPEILASGDHAKVARWRREQALRRTWQRRPDLLRSAPLSDADRAFLAKLAQAETREVPALDPQEGRTAGEAGAEK